MALTLEDLDRRVTVLEKAHETEKNIIRAVAEIVAESEQRTAKRVDAIEQWLDATEQRLTARVSASERRMVDILNERFDQVMTALDRPKNP